MSPPKISVMNRVPDVARLKRSYERNLGFPVGSRRGLPFIVQSITIGKGWFSILFSCLGAARWGSIPAWPLSFFAGSVPILYRVHLVISTSGVRWLVSAGGIPSRCGCFSTLYRCRTSFLECTFHPSFSLGVKMTLSYLFTFSCRVSSHHIQDLSCQLAQFPRYLTFRSH